MPFPVLDACFALFAGEKMAPDEVDAGAARRSSPSTRRSGSTTGSSASCGSSRASIYKWVQAPVSLHVGNLDLERERALQLPVVQRGEWRRV